MRAHAGPATVISRSRYAEDILAEVVKHGVGQYVLVGAGMDTFAFRRPDLQVFEVDHTASQTFRRQRLAEAGLTAPLNLHFVAADLAQENLVTAIDETLRAIRRVAALGSHPVFTYLDPDAFDPQKAAARIRLMLENVRAYGESPRSGLNPHTLETELAHLGFRLLENLPPHDIEAGYFQGRMDGYHAPEHEHFAWAVVA